MSQLKLLKALGRAPLMTMTLEQIKELDLSSNPWRDVNALIEEGMAFRLARGVYTAIPLNKGSRWRPMLEIQALALATARYGDAALMGLGAARYWHGIPRAIGTTVVAVPGGRDRTVAVGRGKALFVPRDLRSLDLFVADTALGQGLVTSPAQTILDLAQDPELGGLPSEALDAIANLEPQVSRRSMERVRQAATDIPARPQALVAT